ncbi:MAG: hypothetical protein QM723_12755 [Myxococcaceae bacterium]
MRTIALALAVSALASCTLGNTIDVCERTTPRERDFNARTEGDQLLPDRNAIAALPSGGALVVWTSVPESGLPEIRGAVASGDGALLPSCDSAKERTFNPSYQYADRAAVVVPSKADALGAVIYRRHILHQHDEIWAVPISADGCALPEADTANQPFALAVADTGGQYSQPTAAILSDGTIVVVFTAFPPGSLRPHLLARRFRLKVGSEAEFLATPLSPHGELADAVETNGAHANAVLVPMSDGAAMAFFELEEDGYRIKLVRFASDFSIRWGPVLLADQKVPTGLGPQDVAVNLAYEPDSFFVTWVTIDFSIQPVVEGIFVSGDGQYLSAPRAPNGGPFRLGSGNGVVESGVSLTGTGEGGFLVAWHESGTATHADRSGFGLRAVGFDRDGAVRFSNRACDSTDFQLNLSTDGDQTQPALTRMADGAFLAAWNTKGGDSVDRDGSGVRAVGLTLRELFPVK